MSVTQSYKERTYSNPRVQDTLVKSRFRREKIWSMVELLGKLNIFWFSGLLTILNQEKHFHWQVLQEKHRMSQNTPQLVFSKYLRCEANKKVFKCSSNFGSVCDKSFKSQNFNEDNNTQVINKFKTFANDQRKTSRIFFFKSTKT